MTTTDHFKDLPILPCPVGTIGSPSARDYLIVNIKVRLPRDSVEEVGGHREGKQLPGETVADTG